MPYLRLCYVTRIVGFILPTVHVELFVSCVPTRIEGADEEYGHEAEVNMRSAGVSLGPGLIYRSLRTA